MNTELGLERLLLHYVRGSTYDNKQTCGIYSVHHIDACVMHIQEQCKYLDDVHRCMRVINIGGADKSAKPLSTLERSL